MRPNSHVPATRLRTLSVAIAGTFALLFSMMVTVPAHALSDTGSGGVFLPTTGRVLDTRSGIGGFNTAMEAGVWRTVDVAGHAGIPDDGTAGAVSVIATVADLPGSGVLSGRPSADKDITTLGVYGGDDGQTTSFSAVLALSADGTIDVRAQTAARLILDVQGYYTANTDGTAPGGFVPLNGKRIVSTGAGLGAPAATIASGQSIEVQVTGLASGIPTGASAAIVNLIAVNKTSAVGYLTPYATGTSRPVTSLNYVGSVPTSMQTQVKLSAGGKITIYNTGSTIDLIVDVQGYFTAPGEGGAVFTPGSGRAFDSRAAGSSSLALNETRAVPIAGVAGVPTMGSGVSAVVLTLTSVKNTAGAGYAVVWADGAAKPNTTAINFDGGTVRTNTVTVPLGANGKILLQNVAGITNYVIDVQGWYAAPGAPTISCPVTGSWNVNIPAEDVVCTVSAPPASETGAQLFVTVDGDDLLLEDLSETSSTSYEASLYALAGAHTITARIEKAETPLSSTTALSYGFGDWSARAFRPTPSDAASVEPDPHLKVESDEDLIDEAATIVYEVATSPTGFSAPIWSSGTTAPADGATLPTSGLGAGPLYWRAIVTGTTGGGSSLISVTTPVWSFSVVPLPTDAVVWTLHSADTLGESIGRAIEENGDSEKVADALDSMSAQLETGASVEFPGLDAIATDEALVLTEASAEAVREDQPLPPEVNEFKLSTGDESGPIADDAARGGGEAIYGGYSWRQYTYVLRIKQQGLKFTTTDAIEVRWTTDPGSKTSKITYNSTYFPNSGYFDGITYRASVREIESIWSTPERKSTGWKSGKLRSTWYSFLTPKKSLANKTIDFKLELHGKRKGRVVANGFDFTADARCDRGFDDSNCYFYGR